MGTGKDDLRRWFDEGVQSNSTFMIVVCDTFSYDDYPVYVSDPADFEKEYERHNWKNMQKIMEVYDLSLDRELQMAERRAFHYPSGFEVPA